MRQDPAETRIDDGAVPSLPRLRAPVAAGELAADVNRRAENIGARRLHTVLEALLEDLSFSAPETPGAKVAIDGAEVRRRLAHLAQDVDLARYIL